MQACRRDSRLSSNGSSDRVTAWLQARSFLGKGLRYICAYAGWRARRMLRARFEGAPAWPDREELAAVLPGRSDGRDLARALRLFYSSRERPPSLCDWRRRQAIVEAVPDRLRARTIATAGAILERRFRFRGREVAFTGPVDWRHCPDGNVDWTWDLNRHHFFVILGRAYWYTGDERYPRAFAELLADWMRVHPPSTTAPAWRSVFEVGVRIVNWCWAHALFLPSSLDDASHTQLLQGILGMARFLGSNIERHAWNNHLLLEARALAMAGLLYPELPGARSWERQGLHLLGEEMDRQVLADGVHRERSSLYHAIIASECLEHLVVLRLVGRGEGDRDYSRILVKLVGMALFLGAITRPDGTFPLLGDSSRGDAHNRYNAALGARALLDAPGILAPPGGEEDLAWLLGALGKEKAAFLARPARESRARQSRAFPEGGYWVLDSHVGGVPLHMVFDCGPFGDAVVPGHGHADALSFDLAVGEDHLIVDPGMYSAHLGERWRNFFRGTSAHNTVVVDGKDQSILKGIRRVYRPARARLLAWITSGAFDLVAGAHLGYLRLPAPVIHEREIFFRKPLYWLVVDRLEGRGDHCFELLFHANRGCRVRVGSAPGRVTMEYPNGHGLLLCPIEPDGIAVEVVEGSGESGEGRIQGWVAFESGVREPAPVIVCRREGPPPARFATLLWPLFPGGPPAPRPEPVETLSRGVKDPTAAATRLVLDDGSLEAVVARPVHRGRSTGPAGDIIAGALETDASVASVSVSARGAVQGGVVAGGTRLAWNGEDLIRLESAGRGAYFAVREEEGRLEVHTASALPPGCVLRFRGSLARAKKVFLNGQEAPHRREEGAIALDWRW